MTEGMEITPGVGQPIAGDLIGGELYQRIKLAVGADGEAADLDGGQQTKALSLPAVIASDQIAEMFKGEDTAHASGHLGIMLLAVRNDAGGPLAGNLDYIPLMVDSGGRLCIAPAPANHGTDIGNVDVGSMPTGASAAQVQGTAAAGSPAADNPVPVGLLAKSASPAAVDDGDVARPQSDLLGRQVIWPYTLPASCSVGNPAAITGNTAVDVLAAAGANLKWYVASVIATNSHATVGTLVTIQDDAGTPNKACQGYCAPAGGGFAISFPVPVALGVNQKVQAICGTTGANVYVTVVGFKSP